MAEENDAAKKDEERLENSKNISNDKYKTDNEKPIAQLPQVRYSLTLKKKEFK